MPIPCLCLHTAPYFSSIITVLPLLRMCAEGNEPVVDALYLDSRLYVCMYIAQEHTLRTQYICGWSNAIYRTQSEAPGGLAPLAQQCIMSALPTWLTFYSHIRGVTGPNSVMLYLTLSQVVL